MLLDRRIANSVGQDLLAELVVGVGGLPALTGAVVGRGNDGETSPADARACLAELDRLLRMDLGTALYLIDVDAGVPVAAHPGPGEERITGWASVPDHTGVHALTGAWEPPANTMLIREPDPTHAAGSTVVRRVVPGPHHVLDIGQGEVLMLTDQALVLARARQADHPLHACRPDASSLLDASDLREEDLEVVFSSTDLIEATVFQLPDGVAMPDAGHGPVSFDEDPIWTLLQDQATGTIARTRLQVPAGPHDSDERPTGRQLVVQRLSRADQEHRPALAALREVLAASAEADRPVLWH